MRFPSQFRLVAVGLFAIFACSPAQPAATPSTSAPTAPSTSAQPQPDLSPAAEPPGVVLLMRVRNPSESLQAADRIARLPTSLGALAREALHAAKLDVLKLDASVDAVLVLDPTSGDGDPKFMAAASLPLSDLEGARAAMQRAGADFQPMVPGVYRGVIAPEHTASEPTNIEESQADDDAPEQTDARNTVQCDLAASVGDAPARVVCADTVDELNALRPWMTRGLPTAPPNTEDFWLAVRFGPLRDKYLPVMRSQTTGLELLASQWLTRELGIQDPALLRVPGQLVEEAMLLVDDLDCVTVTADLDAAGPRADFRGELAFRSKSAWITRAWTDPNDRGGPPPEMFWRLPRSVHSATYGRSADPKHLEPILAGIRHAAGVLLAKGPVSAASRSAVDAFLATIPLHGGTVVSAQGLVPIDEPAPGSKATRTPASAILDIKRLVYESTGWSVVGVEAPASSYVTWLEKTSTMVQHLLRDAAADKALAEDLRNAKWVPKLRVRKGVAGYPQGTTALDVTSDFDSRDVWEFTKTSQAGDEGGTEHPKGAAAKGSITLRLVVVPDGQNRAWIGLSAHDATLRAQMRIVTSPGKTEETVGSLDGLEALRASSSPGGGFFHYGNALRMALRAARLAATERERAKIDTVVATLPHQLQTPMLLFVGGKAGTRPTLGMSFHVQAGTLEDVAALVRYAMSEEGRKHLESLDAGDAAAGAD